MNHGRADHAYITSRFHNLSSEALADALGHPDAILKGAEAECKSLKDEFKRRGLFEVSGENFTVTASEPSLGSFQIDQARLSARSADH